MITFKAIILIIRIIKSLILPFTNTVVAKAVEFRNNNTDKQIRQPL